MFIFSAHSEDSLWVEQLKQTNLGDNGMDTAVYRLESYAAKPASGVTIWSVQGFTKKPFSGFLSTNWIFRFPLCFSLEG